MDTDTWPNCEVPDCPHKIHLGSSHTYCYAHSLGVPLLPEDERVPRYFDAYFEFYGEEAA